MWSHGTGAEVMQRIAVPIIGGKRPAGKSQRARIFGVAWPQGAFLPWDRATPVAEKRPLSAPQKSLAGVMRPFST